MKVNKAVLVLVMFAALLFVPVNVSAQEGVNLEVSVMKYQPYPAVPGSYVDVWIKVENAGLVEANDVVLEVEDAYPFSRMDGYTYTWHVGKLRPGESAVNMFRLMVDRAASAGTNYIKVRYTANAPQNVWVTTKLPVEVEPYQAILSVEKVEFEGSLRPGSEDKMKITIKNVANAYLKNVRVSVGAVMDENSVIIPLGSSSRVISSLDPGDEVVVTFPIGIDASTKSGMYTIPLTITYYDESGNVHTLSESIGIVVNAKPELRVMVESSTGYVVKGKLNNLRISVINSGTTDAKFVDVRLSNAEGFAVLGQEEKYLGEIESDDKETYTVEVYVYPQAGEKIVLPVEVSYRDAMGSSYRDEFEIPVRVYSQDELLKYGVINQRSKLYAYCVLLLVVLYLLKKFNIFGRVRKK